MVGIMAIFGDSKHAGSAMALRTVAWLYLVLLMVSVLTSM
jgi:hypothetical protein